MAKKGKFITRTYKKGMNLLFYTAKHSTHSPGLTKSLIIGLLENILGKIAENKILFPQQKCYT